MLFLSSAENPPSWGLHINWSNTMLQSLSPWLSVPQQSSIGPQTVETTNNFTYLGCTISHNNSCNDDIKRRIAIATSTMSKLASVWRSPRLSLKAKLRLYDSLVILVVTYSAASGHSPRLNNFASTPSTPKACAEYWVSAGMILSPILKSTPEPDNTH